MPNAFQVTCPGADRFTALLGRYLQENTRDAGELVKKKAAAVSVELFKQTQQAAPSAQQIKQDVISRGWKVKRPPGAWPLRKGERRGSAGPLRRMEASVIGRRLKARGVAATGWLPAVDKLGGKPGKKLARVSQPRGTVKIEGIGTPAPKVTISNTTPGIARLEADRHLLKTSFNAVSGDIELYLKKKSAERAAKLKQP